MVTETGTRSEIKKCIFDLSRRWPLAGFSYRLPTFAQTFIVLAADNAWVHVVTEDLHSSTSIERNQWDFFAAHNQIEKANVPWLDMTETRRSLLGS